MRALLRPLARGALLCAGAAGAAGGAAAHAVEEEPPPAAAAGKVRTARGGGSDWRYNAAARLEPATEGVKGRLDPDQKTWAPPASDGSPPDPKLLNATAQEDPYKDIDFQAVPLRIIEAFRRKLYQMSEDDCRALSEEFVACCKNMTTRLHHCRPLLEEYQKCLVEWRHTHPEEYAALVKKLVDGELLEKYRRRMRFVEEEWKKRFPDDPMPKARVPSKRVDQRGKWVHHLDRDVVDKELALHRLMEIDAMQQGMSLEEYKQQIPEHVRGVKGWIPAW
eukprot:TRINITY_DN71519_c0_g1_i1.p1 TRINITY_DN71519_c0_g1~~TRINITY_DN71519_c0_g1_i1.p1  ORF type:complete len:305 (+),score=110.76 TRINITY_DN71519_c0_g1_i1:82-915(+)